MGELATRAERLETVRSLLARSRAQLELALPRALSVDRFIRVALTSVQRTPKLLECDPTSLLAAMFEAAQLGLEPDNVLGYAYLVPFWDGRSRVLRAQFILGYRGLLALARRSGQLSTVEARIVYARDRFEYAFGLHPRLVHVPASKDRGEPTHVYAIVRLKDGAHQWEVMTVEEIEEHRKRYARATGDDTPWATAWEEMAKKTVLRRLLKLAPLSVEAQRAISLDEHAEAGVAQELSVPVDTDASPTAPTSGTALDRLTAMLESSPSTSPSPTPPPSPPPSPTPSPTPPPTPTPAPAPEPAPPPTPTPTPSPTTTTSHDTIVSGLFVSPSPLSPQPSPAPPPPSPSPAPSPSPTPPPSPAPSPTPSPAPSSPPTPTPSSSSHMDRDAILKEIDELIHEKRITAIEVRGLARSCVSVSPWRSGSAEELHALLALLRRYRGRS